MDFHFYISVAGGCYQSVSITSPLSMYLCLLTKHFSSRLYNVATICLTTVSYDHYLSSNTVRCNHYLLYLPSLWEIAYILLWHVITAPISTVARYLYLPIYLWLWSQPLSQLWQDTSIYPSICGCDHRPLSHPWQDTSIYPSICGSDLYLLYLCQVTATDEDSEEKGEVRYTRLLGDPLLLVNNSTNTLQRSHRNYQIALLYLTVFNPSYPPRPPA